MSEKTKNQNNKRNNNKKRKQVSRKDVRNNVNSKQLVNVRNKQIKPLVNGRLNQAQGTSPVISIGATPDLTCVAASGIGLIGMALGRGYNDTDPIYWGYLGFVSDLLSVMTANISPVTGRLKYLNDILASFQPKSVPFRGVGEAAYKWTGLDSFAPTDTISCRGYLTKMWVATAGSSGDWDKVMAAPSAPSNVVEQTGVLAKIFSLLASDRNEGQKFVQDVALGEKYKKDVSGFSHCQTYFGNGVNTNMTPAKSNECEVPFKSTILGCVCDYSGSTRLSRFLRLGAGDSTFAFGFGALGSIKSEWYNSAFCPIFKFIDLQEVVASLIYWYSGLLDQAEAQYPTGGGGGISFALAQFNYTARQFAIMVRQCILAIFNDTQSIAQFLTPSSDGTSNGFEALRIGSNCYGKNLNANILVPNILRENIANLMMSVYGVTEKYHNPKNVQVIIPVWGVMASASDLNPGVRICTGASWSTLNLFLKAPAATDPQIVDCCVASGGATVDVNNSLVVTSLIEEWNERIAALASLSLPTSTLGCSTGNGNLLYYTRIYEYKSVTFNKRRDTRVMEKILVRKPLERKNSKKTGDVILDEYMLPGGTGIVSGFTTMYTSVCEITETVKQLLPYVIFPMLPLDPTATPPSPTSTQYRTIGLEAKALNTQVSVANTDVSNTRLAQIISSAVKWAPGLAASKSDEFSNVIDFMNGRNEGGFFGDLVGGLLTKGVGLIQSAIPI